MEAELVQLAREAVAALQTGPPPNWVEVAQLFVSGVGLACIVGGLFSMKAAGQRRDREIDELAELLRRSAPASPPLPQPGGVQPGVDVVHPCVYDAA